MAHAEIAIQQDFQVATPPDRVFDFLADTRATVAHYPKIDTLIDLGDDCWRWELKPTGIKGISHRLVYSIRYDFDREARRITWAPLQAEADNADIRGSFEIAAAPGDAAATHVTLDTDGRVHLPLPKLMIPAARPVVHAEFKQQIRHFIANLCRALS